MRAYRINHAYARITSRYSSLNVSNLCATTLSVWEQARFRHRHGLARRGDDYPVPLLVWLLGV
jgi:hypothetical protein